MKKIHFLLLFCGIVLLLNPSCQKTPDTCTLIGTVVDHECDSLVLIPISIDPRFAKIKFPVIDGQFEYTFDMKHIESFELVFYDEWIRMGFRPIRFYADKDTVRFTIYPSERYEENIIDGGKVNQLASEYKILVDNIFGAQKDSISGVTDSLRGANVYFSPRLLELFDELRATDNSSQRDSLYQLTREMKAKGEDLTKEAKQIDIKRDALQTRIAQWRYQYFKDNPSLMGLGIMRTDVTGPYYNCFKWIRELEVMDAYNKHYPDHPYTHEINDILQSDEQIKVGGKYIDLTLPDLQGVSHTLSDMIKDKVAIIDLWATWCGPCIRKTRSYKPIYEEFSDKGFTIVGVAAENDNTDAMKDRIEKEGWSWINLVELDHQNRIWDKYGCSFSGGKVVMVDQQGEIVAINPDAEEVRAQLAKLLK